MRAESATLFRRLQATICDAVEAIDGTARFLDDLWERTDTNGGAGGGGRTRVLSGGSVFEQAGVNFSEVHGTLPKDMSERLTGTAEESPFYATGVSLVIHPFSPMVPTTHANFRYLEVGDLRWFGGGSDLTPYYLYEEDASHFHRVQRAVCDRFDPEYYPRFKKQCDEYFFLPHRNEGRGIGGVFFDYLGKGAPEQLEQLYPFVSALGEAFPESYLPIVERRREEPWGEAEKRFQLLRRGRYVEFNLIYDRGTLFGLKTGGRTESILMSLPPTVCWEYNFEPQPGSREARLLEVLKHPRAWS
ncbi:MAG: oxygen-dependent coproporphyrinogen oxidase [Bdellovibrionales bacterium]|nr:oxygen-dependent coproporphyrinogen oxidase [Bdellovibrionales bacterium]